MCQHNTPQMVKEETHGNIYPNTHILDILASWKSYKGVVVTNTHWKFQVDSEYFRGEKAIQSLGHLTKIRLCHSVTAAWMSVLAQTQPRNAGCLWKQRARQSSFLDRKGWEFCYQFISHCWMLVRSSCLLCWKLMRSQTPRVYIDPSQDCNTRLFCEYQCCCLRLGIPVWHEGSRCARDTQALQTHLAGAHQLQQSTEIMLHPDKVTPVTEPLLPRQGRTCEEIISTSLLSPKYKLQGEWRAPAHPPRSLLLCLRWLAQVHALSKEQGETLHSIPWIGWSGEMQQSRSTAPVTSHQWPHAGSPSIVILIGKGRGIRRIGACGCFATAFLMVLARRGDEKAGPRGWGRQLSLQLLGSIPEGHHTKPGPTPQAQLGTATANWVTHFKQAVEILQRAQARFLAAFRKYWVIIFIIK